MPAQIQNAVNFRDLAAHVPPQYALRHGTLFRSDHLGALDEQDAQQIHALGIRRVLDFRGVDERTAAACMLTNVKVHSLAIEPTIVQKVQEMLAKGHELSEQEVVSLMQDTYRNFVRTSTHRFAEFFTQLLESNEPTVFHCTAGKDRTGFAAALVLRALDVPDEIVMVDYMHTNDRLKPATDQWFPLHIARVLWRVQPDFLLAAYEAIEQDYGDMQSYLREGIGLRAAERRRLQELYRA